MPIQRACEAGCLHPGSHAPARTARAVCDHHVVATTGNRGDATAHHIADIARQFEDFRAAEKGGALLTADTLQELAARIRVPAEALLAEYNETEELKARNGTDRFGRELSDKQALKPPLHAVKVTGALFHTQGGLVVNSDACVRRADGSLFPNLFAAGGAAAGVSGNTAAGYLSGNGLLTATTLGRLAGTAAARQVATNRPG